MLQELDLSQCPLRQDLFAEDICNFLDGDTFARLTVGRSTALVYVSTFRIHNLKPTQGLSR
jgi:hypothetical protein